MLLSRLSSLLAFISLRLRLLFLRFQLFLSQTSPLYASERKRSIVLIGDGTAEGFGDALGKTGLTARLSTLLVENRPLRLSWRIVTLGRLWTTASDWHPTRGALFSDLTSKKTFRDADVCILTFGMHDDPTTAPELVADIADALVRMGKEVVVTGLFNPHTPKTEKHAQFRAATEDLKHRLDSIKEQNTSPESGTVAMGVDPVKVCVMGSDALSAEQDFYTFNSRGYRLFASDLYDDVVTAAKRVEWRYWKKQLSPSS